MEQEILRLLQQTPGTPYSLKEISKLVDRQQFRTDPTWARSILQNLEGRQLITRDSDGRYLVPGLS